MQTDQIRLLGFERRLLLLELFLFLLDFLLLFGDLFCQLPVILQRFFIVRGKLLDIFFPA